MLGKLTGGMFHYEGNATAHNSANAIPAIHDSGFQVLAAPDYSVFPKIKTILSSHNLQNYDIIKTVTVLLKRPRCHFLQG